MHSRYRVSKITGPFTQVQAEESYRETPVGILKIYQNSDGCDKLHDSCCFCHFFHKEMVEQSDHSSDSKYRNNGSNANSNQFVGKNQAHADSNADIQKIKTVLGKSYRFMYAI